MEKTGFCFINKNKLKSFYVEYFLCAREDPFDINICFTGGETDLERLRVSFMATQLKSGRSETGIQKPVL